MLATIPRTASVDDVLEAIDRDGGVVVEDFLRPDLYEGLPGSHRGDDERLPEMSEAVPCEMSPGSALLFIGSTFHGGGANATTDGHVPHAHRTWWRVARRRSSACSAGRRVRSRGWGWVEIDGQMADPVALLPKLERLP